MGVDLPAPGLAELWIDNLAPPADAVVVAVENLLEDKDKFARLLPWLMKIARSQRSFPDPEVAVRDLIAKVRAHFQGPFRLKHIGMATPG